tara:strand:+ start:3351 stop:3656 length:306 start_codon:yes stop_codon:yes gene_type:complete
MRVQQTRRVAVVQRDLLLTVSASLSGTLLKLRQRDVSTTRRKDIRIREKHPWKPSVGLGIDGVSLDVFLKLFYLNLLTGMLSNISNHHKCFQASQKHRPHR